MTERTRACTYLENESYHPSFQQPKYYAPMEGFAAVRVREELRELQKKTCNFCELSGPDHAGWCRAEAIRIRLTELDADAVSKEGSR